MFVDNPFSTPPPPFVMVTACVNGSASPMTALNVRLDAESTIDGGVVTVRDTGTASGVLDAPGDAMFTVALYVPAAKPVVLGCTVSVGDAPAVLSVSVSQPAVPVYCALAVNPASVPPPLLLIVSNCAAGAGPDDVNVSEVGATAIVGCELMMSVTATSRGALLAPAAVMRRQAEKRQAPVSPAPAVAASGPS